MYLGNPSFTLLLCSLWLKRRARFLGRSKNTLRDAAMTFRIIKPKRDRQGNEYPSLLYSSRSWFKAPYRSRAMNNPGIGTVALGCTREARSPCIAAWNPINKYLIPTECPAVDAAWSGVQYSQNSVYPNLPTGHRNHTIKRGFKNEQQGCFHESISLLEIYSTVPTLV